MEILTPSQIKELDRYTIIHEPVSSVDLTERAAGKVVEELKKRWLPDTRFVLFAGPGNNGGDTLAVARLLHHEGYRIQAYLFNPSGRLSEDCLTNKNRLEALGEDLLTEVSSQFLFPELEERDVIVDGLFGIGLHRPLSGGYAGLVKKINECPNFTVSIDMPSGLMSEDNGNNDLSAIIRAHLTLTFHTPKLAFFFTENQPYIGELQVLDIGLLTEGMSAGESGISLTETEDIRQTLRPRDPFAHKGSMGHALLVSGQYGMAGAAILAAKACLRSGAGKLTIHTPGVNNNILQCSIPEAILSHDTSDTRITAVAPTYGFQALAIGPGIGTHEDTAEVVHSLIRNHPDSIVLDADALNILGNHPEWIPEIPKETILTPHPKELENLVGHCTDSYDRMTRTRNFAIKMQLYVVIKGHYSMICTPSGRVLINPTGNAGMATAGSGDVLTGLLAGLLAQGYTPSETCLLGVYLHGLAGDIACEQLGEEGLMASDIADAIPRAYKLLKRTTT